MSYPPLAFLELRTGTTSRVSIEIGKIAAIADAGPRIHEARIFVVDGSSFTISFVSDDMTEPTAREEILKRIGELYADLQRAEALNGLLENLSVPQDALRRILEDEIVDPDDA